MQYNIHSAKTQLSRLIESALAGGEVVIARDSQPVVRLVPIPQNGLTLGLLQGELGTPPDFLEPLPQGNLADWEGGE